MSTGAQCENTLSKDRVAAAEFDAAALKTNLSRVAVENGLIARECDVLVKRANVFVDVMGSEVANTCVARDGFRPVLSSAAGGKVPSALKFSAEA